MTAMRPFIPLLAFAGAGFRAIGMGAGALIGAARSHEPRVVYSNAR
jgi:hypothetical protein